MRPDANFRITPYILAAVVGWTCVLAVSFGWNWSLVEKTMVESARIQARGNFMKDVVYRRWNSIHGGVYAPVTQWTPPNPYLSERPERDIQSPSGKKLTLINPAYMTRQAFELGQAKYGLIGHITSLNPIRPENAADLWEAQAMKAFEKGEKEASSLRMVDGKLYLRFMRPLLVEKNCLSCHAHQGYKLNQIRGGISVAVPMQPFEVIADAKKDRLLAIHLVLWLIGIGAIVCGSLRLSKSRTKQLRAENDLRIAFADMERQVASRTAEYKMANDALESQKRKFQVLIDESPNIMALIGKDQHFQYLNPRFEQVFGYAIKDIPTRDDWFEKAYPDPLYRKKIQTYWQQAEEQANPAMISNQMREVRCKDGSNKWVQISAAFLSSGEKIITYQDVTGQRELEEKLRQAQKMEAIGTLAGGIAHDFNNILSAILGYSELVKEDLPERSASIPHINEVIKAGLRARNLVQHILDFSRETKPKKRPLSIHLVVKEALALLRATIPATIEIRQKIGSSGMVLGDADQIHQIVMNLCTNAFQSMQKKGGVLEIQIKPVSLEPVDVEQYPDLTPGSYVQLSVSDTGGGMTPDIMRRIFDPYFTTKTQGEGTGLGLSVIHGIVKNHDGGITVYSEPEKGSIFNVYLPLIDSDKQEEEALAESPLPSGDERILFVDDEPALTELGRKMLGSLGYQVTTRNNGNDALELMRDNPYAVDLVITDMTMPHMSGAQLARELLCIRVDLPIILCTGFSHNITASKAKEMGIREFVLKPLIRKDMVKVVRKVLDTYDKNQNQ